ncbi:aminotransferase class IV family protein, partial [Vibrio parahaemolyticus V-223/04]
TALTFVHWDLWAMSV